MAVATLQPTANAAAAQDKATPVPDRFIHALFSDGDSRIAADPRTGLNKYFCPTALAPDLLCASSCTASPISVDGFNRALETFSDITSAPSRRLRVDRLAAVTKQIEARLLHYFDVGTLARAFLCPSGTDALLMTAMLIAAERPGTPITAILPAAAETGSGVPMAALCRLFDGADSGVPLTDTPGTTVEIPLRSSDGSPRPDDEVNHAFAAATAAAHDSAVVYLTHGTKTGLISPAAPPRGANVIVDACQARIEPRTVAAYLRQGWPVVVTGSKFFGGPAFSGAVLFPRARLPATARGPLTSYLHKPPRLGTALRWMAAIAGIDAFDPTAAGVAKRLSDRTAAIAKALASNPALVPIAGLHPHGSAWAAKPSIFTFAVRDPSNRAHRLSVQQLRPLYEQLARGGILLGQPVDLGSFGGLRLAIGARDLLVSPADAGWARLFAVLEAATAPSGHHSGGRHWD